MFLSVLDIFKVGIGPSSSHTMGPMIAAARFLEMMRTSEQKFSGLKTSLHGSLAFTGIGHATDRAITLGFAGLTPETYNTHEADHLIKKINKTKSVSPNGFKQLKFDPTNDLIFDYETQLTGHANGMVMMATDVTDRVVLRQVFYSIGGGFVIMEEDLNIQKFSDDYHKIPFPFKSATEMLNMSQQLGKSIAEMKHSNEMVYHCTSELENGIARIWNVMRNSIERGLNTAGKLPGSLKVKRRACDIYTSLLAEQGKNHTAPHTINDWISVYAMAVNEENAAGGQIVTAPTNGAAGVIPAVLNYYLKHVPGATSERIEEFLLTAAAIGGLIKFNASISGAEAGCQAEVGSASAMAAAGLCAILDGTPEQVENAAEIALEHHMGMTCDPVQGLVQVPCIERNGLGAIKAVSAASISLRGDGTHLVPLDSCIETMRQTGLDMSYKYKETSLGGLAVNIPNC
ncbi:MAG: L-serine ammonia-lyase [Aestuariivita sp.]|nr:L-serine ammonia-lyase [Aestuariivita sp.]